MLIATLASSAPHSFLLSHNAFGYDAHREFRAFIQHPALENKRVSVLAKTLDTYRSASIFIGEEGWSIK